jgi:hypothetical protein
MARCPFATWTPAAPENFSAQAITPTFIVEHVAEGWSQGGIISWFKNPRAQVSSHFSISLLGKLCQHVDTNQMAYHCAQMNDKTIGIENLGYNIFGLRFFQKRTQKKLLAWIKAEHKIRLELTFNQNDPKGGVIPHGKINEGALSHPNCPGQKIINDVHKILDQMNFTPPVPKSTVPTQAQLDANNLVALPSPEAEYVATKNGWAVRWYNGKGFPLVNIMTPTGITYYSNVNYTVPRTSKTMD